MAAEQAALEAQRARVAHARALELDRPGGGHHPPRLIGVAVTYRLVGSLLADTADELDHLVLKRLLQDQPRAQPTDPLDRIGLAVDAGQPYLHQLRLVRSKRGYVRPAFRRVVGRHPEL